MLFVVLFVFVFMSVFVVVFMLVVVFVLVAVFVLVFVFVESGCESGSATLSMVTTLSFRDNLGVKSRRRHCEGLLSSSGGCGHFGGF